MHFPDDEFRRQVESQARHEHRAYFERLFGVQTLDEHIEDYISLLMSDVGTWVRNGTAQPSECTLSYPRSLLEQAYGRDAELLKDVDCSKALLSDENLPLPKHLCPGTVRASTRVYALSHFPPRNAAQRKWIGEWPLPVGERSIRAFARRHKLSIKDLPPALVRDNPTAQIGLWVERNVEHWVQVEVDSASQVDVPAERKLVSWGPLYSDRVILVGRACTSNDSPRGPRSDHLYELCAAHTYTIHKSSAGSSVGGSEEIGDDEFVLSPQMSVGHDDEWSRLAEAKRTERELILWYERVALGVPNEFRGRKPGPTDELTQVQQILPLAYAEAKKSKGSKTVRRADLVRAIQILGLNVSPSTFYGWIRSGKLSPESSQENSE